MTREEIQKAERSRVSHSLTEVTRSGSFQKIDTRRANGKDQASPGRTGR